MDFQENATLGDKCPLEIKYFEEEFYCYLFIMLPLAIAGVLLNLLSLKVFSDKSFNSVTFKYLRLITVTDCFICMVIIPYCLTMYTQPFNKYDLYARHFYLAYIYIPGANMAMNLSTLLNLLVTIERLISVGWPTYRYSLFKPSRYIMSCMIVIAIAFLSNFINMFLYKIEICKSNPLPREFLSQTWWVIYGYVKEVLTRIVPILMLIVANMILVYIVRSSRRRMKESLSFGSNMNKKVLSSSDSNNGGAIRKLLACPWFGKKSSDSTTSNDHETHELTSSSPDKPPTRSTSVAAVSSQQIASKKSRQENQLTVMTIVVAVLYCVTSIPMVFAFPGLVFTSAQTMTKLYKMYAVLVNILELVQCSFRFFIYFCFTAQFRQVLGKMTGVGLRAKAKRPSEMNETLGVAGDS